MVAPSTRTSHLVWSLPVSYLDRPSGGVGADSSLHPMWGAGLYPSGSWGCLRKGGREWMSEQQGRRLFLKEGSSWEQRWVRVGPA